MGLKVLEVHRQMDILSIYSLWRHPVGTIQKWGNSLGVRLPKAFVDQLGLHDGSEIEVAMRDGEIVIRPLRPHYTLQGLLAGCTDDNRHAPIEWGPNVGREVL